MKASMGEERIIELLQKGGYEFEREKSFSDFLRGRYRYDFYVHGAQPCLIEYQGRQHYEMCKLFYKNRSEFLAAQERDRKKISYALAHNIPLYIIPYWELPKFTFAGDLFNSKYLAKSRWKNDEDWRNYKI